MAVLAGRTAGNRVGDCRVFLFDRFAGTSQVACSRAAGMDSKQAAGRKAAGSASDAHSAGPSFPHYRATGYGLLAELFRLLQFSFLVANHDEKAIRIF